MSIGHLKSEFWVHSYTFYNFKTACLLGGVCLLGGLPIRGVCLLGALHSEGRPPVNRQTGVKTLPYPAVGKKHSCSNIRHRRTCSPFYSGVDPAFSIEGGVHPRGEGRQHMILPNFPKNCMKSIKIWTVGGPPLDPPLPLNSATATASES